MPASPSGGTLATILSIVDGTIPKADTIASQKPWAMSPSAYRPRVLKLHTHTDCISSQGQENAQAPSLHPPFHQLGRWKVVDGVC